MPHKRKKDFPAQTIHVKAETDNMLNKNTILLFFIIQILNSSYSITADLIHTKTQLQSTSFQLFILLQTNYLLSNIIQQQYRIIVLHRPFSQIPPQGTVDIDTTFRLMNKIISCNITHKSIRSGCQKYTGH